MRAALIGLAISLIASASLAEPRQFDLVCSGELRDDATGSASPWSTRIAVDLDAAAYCDPACVSARPIARIEPGVIYFEDEPAVTFMANRATGNFLKSWVAGTATGHCAVATFTAMPKKQF